MFHSVGQELLSISDQIDKSNDLPKERKCLFCPALYFPNIHTVTTCPILVLILSPRVLSQSYYPHCQEVSTLLSSPASPVSP